MKVSRRILWPSLALALVTSLLLGASPANVAVSSAAGDIIRENWMAANDLIYDPANQKLYASVPGSAGSIGNHIAIINPDLQMIEELVYVGSEPYKLALSPNSEYLYVALGGSASVARLDLETKSVDLEFALGSDPFFGPYYAEDIVVLPENPRAVAVSRKNLGISPRHAGVAVYENGVQRSVATARHTGSNVIEAGTVPGRLYGYNNETTEFGFRRMNVDASGVSVLDVTQGLVGAFSADIAFANGLVYTTKGQAIEPEQRVPIGSYANVGFAKAVSPDPAANRISFLTGTSLSSHYQIMVFDLQRFTHLGTIDITTVVGTPSSLVRWGTDGLAFRTDEGQVFLVQSPLISGAPLPTPSSTPVSTATAVPTHTPVPTPTFVPTPTPTNTPTPSPTPVPSMHVFDLEGSAVSWRSQWEATVEIGIHDANNEPIAGATVTGQWQDGYSVNTWCTTGVDGRCTVSTGNVLKKQSSVTFKVGSLVYGAYVYDGGSNHDTDGDSNGTVITVNKPR